MKSILRVKTAFKLLVSIFSFSLVAATQSIELRSDYYMNQSETFFRQGASGEMSSVSVETQGRIPILGSRNSVLGNEYSLSKPLQFGWNVSDYYSSSEGWNYAKPRELYVEYKMPRWSMAVGAKKFDNLKTTEAWSNPVWFARYREDKINTQSIGPVGLHNYFDLGGGWSVSSVLIAAHIPDFGPHQSLDDGQFVSRNPWFRPPPDQINLGIGADPNRKVKYTLNTPKTEDVVGKPGAILQVQKKIGQRQSVKVVGARKAMPALHFSFPVRYRQLANDEYIDLPITPVAVNHTTAAVEWTYQTNPEETDRAREIFTSVQYENPDIPTRDETWISQSFKETLIASTGYKQVVRIGSLPLGLELSYWQVFGGDGADTGEFAAKESVFERRYDYIQAVKLGLSMRQGKVATSSSLIYDYAQQGMLWSTRLNYRINREWSAAALMDILGLLGPTGSVNDGLLSMYRANDRFGLGVAYVF